MRKKTHYNTLGTIDFQDWFCIEGSEADVLGPTLEVALDFSFFHSSLVFSAN